MGWTEIAEEDLTQERSSRAVNKAIVDLSTGRNDFIDNVAKWGDVKYFVDIILILSKKNTKTFTIITFFCHLFF